jgi:hypothetical protein
LTDAYRQVSDFKVKELLDRRYDRLQSYGRFTDTKADAKAVQQVKPARRFRPTRRSTPFRLRLPLAVALSGGADSTALLIGLCQRRWPGQVAAIHVHHGLQPAADGFVAPLPALCAALQVPLVGAACRCPPCAVARAPRMPHARPATPRSMRPLPGIGALVCPAWRSPSMPTTRSRPCCWP